MNRLAAARALIVFDLEYTAWEGSRERRWTGPGEHREVVQFGAVRVVPAEGFAETAALSVLVHPRVNPRLSAYFTGLTGITQERLESEGVPFPDGLARFTAFAAGADALLCNGADAEVIAETCGLNGMATPFAGTPVIDAGPLLAEAAGRPGARLSSGTLHTYIPGVPDLGAHDALADARMVAAAVRIALSRQSRESGCAFP